MITGERVVCISSIDWDAKWQGHQEIASAFAAAGSEVLFIENTGVRTLRLRDASRVLKRARNWRRGRAGLRTAHPRLQIHSPILLPFPYSPTAVRLNCRLLGRSVARWTARVPGPRPILLTFLPTPLVLALAERLQPELIVYYLVDDLASSSPGAARIRATEPELLRTADLVFVTAERLRARARRYRDEVHLLPAGVAFAEFERARTSPAKTLAELDGIPGPIVGFVGGINQKVDDELLAGVARRLPDIHFVVVGPVLVSAPALEDSPNVHVLGMRPHASIPRFLKGVAAGIIPYRVTEYTSHIYPAKLNEYLAMGLPVVSTPLPEVVRFADANPGLVRVAGNPEAFATALRQALKESSPVETRRRIAAAHANRWELKIDAMSHAIARMLDERRSRTSRPGDRTIGPSAQLAG